MSKLVDLKALAKEHKLTGYSTMKKSDLVKFLEESGIKIPIVHKERKETNLKTEVSKPKKKVPSEAKKETDSTEKKPGAKKETDSTEKKHIAKKEKPEFEKSDMVKPKTVFLKLENEKSKKFWEIIYENSDNEKQKYIVRYGKVDSPGTTSKNEDTSEKIQKLIKDKKEKGYAKP
jgi:predicted DNA-binding WGR domain protein